MDDILKIAKNYSKEKHIELLPASENNILDSLLFLFDENWEEEGAEYPYEIITYLLDCYYVLPERPDLASLFCWQAINHSYYNELLGDLSRRCSDTDGVKKVCEDILSNKAKYDPILQQFIVKLPIKVFHYVASYIQRTVDRFPSISADRESPKASTGITSSGSFSSLWQATD